MTEYKVTDKHGHEIVRGDKITDFRENDWIFLGVSRGPEFGGTPKVMVTNDLADRHAERQYYATVFLLSIEVDRELDRG